MISGCGSKVPKLENGSDAIVTFDDGSMISVDDLYNSMKDSYALQTLLNLVDEKIIMDKYADKLDTVQEYVDNHLLQLQAQYGDTLESEIQKNTSYATQEDYLHGVYVTRLQQLAMEEYGKAQIKDKDIEKYYEDEIVGDIKVSHILITAKVTDDMTSEEKTAAEDEAKEQIQEIIDTLKGTKKEDLEDKFAELAKEKSEDTSTKDSGGSLGYINKGTLGTAYAELEEAAYKLKDGEYSTKVITTQLGYHVIIRLDSKEKADLETVREDIIETLASEYLSTNAQLYYVKALKELRDEYGVDIQDSDIKKLYANYIQYNLTELENQSTQTTTN